MVGKVLHIYGKTKALHHIAGITVQLGVTGFGCYVWLLGMFSGQLIEGPIDLFESRTENTAPK